VAGRPPKTLLAHVRERSFRPHRHAHLLAEADLPFPVLAREQERYRRARSAEERAAALAAFVAHLREAYSEQDRRIAASTGSRLQAALRELGRPGSFRQLERFFPRFLRHQAGERAGQPFVLERFQRDFLKELWRRDRRGRRIYSAALLGIPKGNGKSPLAAGLGLHALVSETDAPEVYGIAGSKDQAAIAQRFARTWVEQGELGQWVESRRDLRCPEHNGFYRVLSSDGRLSHGVNPSAAIVDEWWLFASERECENYEALARALHKRGPGRAWSLAITTAGFDKQGQLGRTYERCLEHPQLEIHARGFLKILRDEESGFLFWWYGAPEERELAIDDPRVVRACNPASWVDPEQLLRDLHRPDTDELDWRRLHLNQWTSRRDAWLPNGTWSGLRSELDIPERAEIFVGVDVGLKHDASAVAWAYRHEDGRIVLRCQSWTASAKGNAHEHVGGGELRLELIEQFIRQLGRRYRIREIAYDPTFFARSAQLLGDEGFELVECLPASGRTSEAYQSFYQACREGSLNHDGDPVLAAHVEAAAAERTERGWRIRKLKSTDQIDACVAAVLAHARAQLAPKRRRVPQIYWL
jgi:phage terminase large subunit-like protein